MLQDKASLEALVVQFGTPSRIAKHLGCSKSTASYALRRLGVKPRYFVADERVLAGFGVR
ncbi:MAG: helix-turn-helix domain-containing protein [Methanocorpusculum sp.]|nr:helix-turn-helix domain-containing protein [Methanocorpusculum sp.]